MAKLILYLIEKTIGILNAINANLKKMDKHLNDDTLTLIRLSRNTLGRNINFVLSNSKLFEKKDLFFQIYKYLMSNTDFLEFGKRKIIIVMGRIKSETFNLHHNILIDNETTFEDYWNNIKDIIENIYDEGYAIEGIPIIEVNVWNMDNIANKKIKITKNALTGLDITTITDKETSNTLGRPVTFARAYHESKGKARDKKNGFIKSLLGNKKFYTTNSKDGKYLAYITPIKPRKKKSNNGCSFLDQPKPMDFSAMDIETMAFNNTEIPVSISIKTRNKSNIFIIDPIKLKNDLNIAIKDLWDIFFDFILINCNNNTIFVHNLGSFDGFFIYKALSNKFKPEEVTCLIDNHNKFIQIILQKEKLKIVWKDSYRIFPVSLDDLCKILDLPGKISKYNPEFHKISLFDNGSLFESFKDYSLQDSISLFNCIFNLQEMYLQEYSVDICSVLSTSTLSLKIFRRNYLDVNIPILKRKDDTFIRKSYFGGATDYYQLKGENLHYYDVNSLYPFVMCKPMPFEFIRKRILNNTDTLARAKGGFNLDNFFGFLKVEVTCPKNIKVPILPCKYKSKTIFPTGKWFGTYFSEELKAVKPYGYTFKFIEGYEFSKMDLFSNYVHHFYEQKKNSIGPSRFIAKMHLNQLYGIFGRKHDLLETVNIYKKDLEIYLSSRIIKSIIPINDEIVALLMHKNISDDLITKLNFELHLNLSNYQYLVKANVALASAVTSYARIHMIPFKVDGSCIYSDTDSIFTTKKLDNKHIGKDLGLMKDELNGLIIKEAYFLGIKKYGYQYIDLNNNLISKSTFSSIQRDSLTFEEIIKLSNGDTLVKEIPLRFYKSLKNLNITIDSTHVSISRSLDKILINNKYIPLHIRVPVTINNSFFNYLKRKILILITSIIS